MGQDNLHMQPATWLVRREIIEAAGRWNELVLVDEDGEYFCRIVLASDGIRFVPGAKVFYRVSGSGSYTQRTLFDADIRWHSNQLQFALLRSLGDNGRIRTACVNYLQNLLIFYYPQRPDIMKQAESLAASVGGLLEPPKLRWKYAWIQKLWGYDAARRAQFFLPNFKARALSSWDKAMFRLERRASR
jgi:hypothetical protein